MDDRNGYMLAGRRARCGYDWWWHSFVGINAKSSERQPFFVEYFVINPAYINERNIEVVSSVTEPTRALQPRMIGSSGTSSNLDLVTNSSH